MHNFGEWIEHFSWVQYISMTSWLYSSVAVVHYFTLLVMVGTAVFVDLRVLGIAATRKPIAQVGEQIYPWMWGAFWLAVFSGFLMFTTDAGDYLPDTVFRVKMTVILLAVIFSILLQRSIPRWAELPSPPAGAKVLASISLLLWIGSILAGVEIAAISGLG
ncbi:MAG: DUF6644 family protein [Candidatus Acidiferrales bacterium]